MNRKLIANKIINSELSDYWDSIDLDCDEWCACKYCKYCINDRRDFESYIYEDWLDSRKRKLFWFIDDDKNTVENIIKSNERK